MLYPLSLIRTYSPSCITVYALDNTVCSNDSCMCCKSYTAYVSTCADSDNYCLSYEEDDIPSEQIVYIQRWWRRIKS